MTEFETLRFAPFSSAPKVAFWQAVGDAKLRDWRLDDGARAITGAYWPGSSSGGGARLELGASSVGGGAGPEGALAAPGRLTLVNTVEAFRSRDKNAFLADAAAALADAMDSGAAWERPEVLAGFEVLAFADLKTQKFVYWFAFPALALDPAARLAKSEPLASLGGDVADRLVAEALASVAFAFDPATNTILTLAAAAAVDDAPRTLVFRATAARVACIRATAAESVVLDVALPEAAAAPSARRRLGASGGRMGPRSVDLAHLSDPAELATAAATLNLELMRWRLLPDLDVDKLKATKCLLLGAGTLGCAVSRNLVAWGVAHVTFVDSGKVSYSNPARQSLYEVDDAAKHKDKAVAAADALQRIAPGTSSKPARFEGRVMTIAMPGHSLAGDANAEQDLQDLSAMVAAHDVVFLLTDTREARWLPTVLAAAHDTLLINVALGLDTFVVSRHGLAGQGPGKLGCYFCNDVMAPSDSSKDRTLDQQCTVSRPGLAPVASALAVELLVALLHHPAGGAADADPETPLSQRVDAKARPLGILPHSVRGFLTHFQTVLPTTRAFDKCSACSDAVVGAFRDRGFGFVAAVAADPAHLEAVSGLTGMKADVGDWEDDDDDDF
ncbi:Atg12 activating enzyme [Aureococcus anophagefferens]|nr:Atg12 activating enzyme [Aureococcus anophagefferens]